MGMPIGELGERMSNHELTVVWPAYFEQRRIMHADAEKEATEKKSGRRLQR
jgi:hypothetical protein